MKEKTRNVLVGLTLIIGVVLFGSMILIFQDLPGFMQMGYRQQFKFWATGQLETGSDVRLAGQRVGRVTDIAFQGGDVTTPSSSPR